MFDLLELFWYRFLWRFFGVRQARAMTAQLIASLLDFDQAMGLADTHVASGEMEGVTAKTLVEGMNSSSVIDQIGAAINVRLILAAEMTDAELERYIQHLQNRYSVAVGAAAYARYAAGIPDNLFKHPKKMRAELQTLSYRLRLAYAITHIRDSYLAEIRRWCVTFLILSFIAVALAFGYQDLVGDSMPRLNLGLIAVIGFVGALTSIARRANQLLASSPLEDDPVIQASALQQGRASLMIAGLSGPVFAVFILFVFMGSALSVEPLTPSFTDQWVSGLPRHADFEIFQYHLWLKAPVDAAKMTVWAFTAGFAEQFVPDVLDRFASLGNKKG